MLWGALVWGYQDEDFFYLKKLFMKTCVQGIHKNFSWVPGGVFVKSRDEDLDQLKYCNTPTQHIGLI